jgi:hypothetical protein
MLKTYDYERIVDETLNLNSKLKKYLKEMINE